MHPGEATNDQLRRELARIDALFASDAEHSDNLAAVALAQQLATEHGARRRGSPNPDAAPILPGVERAQFVYQLSNRECLVLAIALVGEIDDRYGTLFALVQRDATRTRPSVGLVTRWLAALADGDVVAATAVLAPDSHLVRSGLVEISGDGPRGLHAVQLADGIWPRLLGIPGGEPFVVRAVSTDSLATLILAPATRAAATTAIAWARRSAPKEVAIIIDGAEHSGRTSLAVAIAHEIGYGTIVVSAGQIESVPSTRALVREVAWHHAALVIAGAVTTEVMIRLCREISTPIIVVGTATTMREVAATTARRTIGVEVAALELSDREALWRRWLATAPHADDVRPATLAAQFRFAPGQIKGIVGIAATRSDARGQDQFTTDDLEVACSLGAVRPGSLATRVECPYDDDDIVLPPATRRELALIRAWSQHRATAFRPDGAGSRIRGRGGLVCLFAGPPGTGKTMAAQIIARSLRLQLLRIDLSQVVNKYIGETEKNLERVFSEAEGTGALLFFDEADALFGKRTDVRDAHDRYANLETAYLLQRLEDHPGVVILASNLQNNLDAAFVRRIQVVAEFPIPGVPERHTIWDRHLARDHLADDIDLDALATMFPLAGGDIRNAVITGVLLAATDAVPVAMRHLAIGVWRELHKTGRLMSPDDFGPWRDDVLAYVRDSRV